MNGSHDLVAAVALGSVELGVGGLDELVGGGARGRCDGRDADADGDDAALAGGVRLVEVGDRGADPFGDDASAGDVGAGQDDGELLAAVAGDEVGVADGCG